MSHLVSSRALKLLVSLMAVAAVGAFGAGPALAAGGTIDATVSVPNAAALTNVAAVLVDANGQADSAATASGPSNVSGDTEQFTFSNVTEGASYYVYFYDGTAADDLAPTFAGGATLATATTVTMPATGGTVNAAGATMVAGGEITGTVTNASTSAALSGGTVTAIPAVSGAAVSSGFLTDGAGTLTVSGNSYTLSGLPSGEYVLQYANTATSPSYPKVYYAGTAVTQLLGGATDFNITTGSAAQSANFAVPEAGTVSGTVLASGSDAPLAGVIVQFYTTSGQPVVRTTTGSTGNYSESDLLPGTYKLSFTQTNPALPLALQYYSGAATLAKANAVAVVAGGTIANINVALAPGGGISGTVVAARGEAPLGDTGVYVMDSSGDVLAHTTTASDGSYGVENLPAGVYYVEFGGPNAQDLTLLSISALAQFGYVPEFYGGEQSLAGAKAVTVTGGATTTKINGALLPASATAVGPATESRGSLSGLGKNKATLAFTVVLGSGEPADASSVAVKLPSGFGWDRKVLAKDLSLNGSKFSYSVIGRTLTVTFGPGQRRFRLTVAGGGVTVSKVLRTKATHKQIASVTVGVTLTDSQGSATPLSVVVKRPS
jgi:Carboxypeptidase regulatory-like domain